LFLKYNVLKYTQEIHNTKLIVNIEIKLLHETLHKLYSAAIQPFFSSSMPVVIGMHGGGGGEARGRG
jgi:hypothetical protein